MSTHRIVVSRSGLTACPQCGAHIKLAADIGQTTCPFCGSNLSEPRRSRRQMLASALGASAGLAVLLGVATGCKTTASQQDDPPPTTPSSPDAGSTTDVDYELAPAPDPQPQPEYGMPMPAPDPPVQALYGAPPPRMKVPKPPSKTP